MSYVRIEYPKIQAFKSDGTLAVGYKIYTYDAGTSDLCTTYSERTLTTPNTNPVVLNARGEADIFTSTPIKLVLTTDTDAVIWTVDYAAEQQTSAVYSGTCVTASNTAAITGSPTASALSNNMMLVYVPDADNTKTMGATTSVVAGPDDCVYSGPYTGTISSIFRVEIDGDGVDPETFKWRKDVEDYTGPVEITGGDQTLKEGVSVNFAVLVGHTNGDYWTQAVSPPYKINLDSLGAKVVYKNSGGTLIPLEEGDIKTGYPVIVVYSTSQACWLLINTADYTAAAEAATDRIRYQKTDDYTLESSDHGNEISFNPSATKTLTLPAAANFADKFVYVTNRSAYTITITADGAEKIYSSQAAAGATSYYMKASNNATIQISTNGVDWQIMTETRGVIKKSIYTTAETGQTHTPDVDTKYAYVEVYSGGAGNNSNTAGGGGGGYGAKWIAKASLSAQVITVGAGGASGANGNASSYGEVVTVTGGTCAGSHVGGTGSGGDINLTGGTGWRIPADSINVGGTGAGPLGGGPGIASGYYVGGGGATDAGAAGLVIITEYK